MAELTLDRSMLQAVLQKIRLASEQEVGYRLYRDEKLGIAEAAEARQMV